MSNSRSDPRLVLALLVAAQVAMFAQTPARARTVTILHFNDSHELGASEGGRVGGLARVATIIDRLKRSTPPLVVTHGGDFLSPSPLGTARVDGEPLAGRQAVAVLNAAGVQWATLGNHEFDVSEAAFRARVREAKFTLVSSNVVDSAGRPFDGIQPSTIATVTSEGRAIRLGIIGLTIDFNRKPWVAYKPIVESAKVQVDALRGRVDAIVALTHQALASDQQLAIAVPEIDVILGGHEHENWMIRRGPRFTPIVKADANGRSAAIVTLTFGAVGTRPTVSARLQYMDESVPPQARVRDELARWTQVAFDAFRREGFEPTSTVVRLPEPLDGREGTVRNRPGSLTDLIVAAMRREASQAVAALLNGGSVRVDDVIAPGPLTEYDVLRMLPFGGKVVQATLDGPLLLQVLDAGAANQGSGGYLHASGITRDAGAWLINGQPLDPSSRYVVALPEFLLTGGESRMGFLTRDNPQVHDVKDLRDIRQAVVAELKARFGGGVLRFFGDRLQRVAGVFRE
jgi:5'-nucleotidase